MNFHSNAAGSRCSNYGNRCNEFRRRYMLFFQMLAPERCPVAKVTLQGHSRSLQKFHRSHTTSY